MSTSRRLDAVTSSNSMPKGMNRNRLSRPGKPRRKMGEYQIIHFAAREDPITGGKLQPGTPYEGRLRILAALACLADRLLSCRRGHCADEGLSRRRLAPTPPPPGCGDAAAPATCDRRRPS